MSSATTLTIDLPVSRCEPPPVPAAAIKPRRSRQRPASLAPGMRIGAWRIERELGRGGMATVFAVVHARFGKRAALKLAHSAVLGPQFTSATFLREARMANLIDHSGVAEVFATGTYGGRPYLAMERLTGRSLGSRLDEGALPRDEALEILIELCSVLEAAHAAGITHRDLKLDNVFLLDEPGAGGRRTKLLDWGMARVAGEDDPLRGLIAGTLTYVAPEQFRGDDITPAADIYALGVLGYLLLLGRAPFTAVSDIDLARKHLHDAPPAPRTRWTGIPAELEAMLVAMLAKRPEDRPGLGDITRALHGARARLRPSKLGWFAAPAVPPDDMLGRPAIALLATRSARVAGAALGVALTALSLLQLFSA